jgi:hypothetical protein
VVLENSADSVIDDTCIQPDYFKKIAQFIRDEIVAKPEKQTIPGQKGASIAKEEGAEALSRVPVGKAEL